MVAHIAHFVRLELGITGSYVSEHFLTYENVGIDKNNDGQVIDPASNEDNTGGPDDEINPYFSSRTDQIGFRLKNAPQTMLQLHAALHITF